MMNLWLKLMAPGRLAAAALLVCAAALTLRHREKLAAIFPAARPLVAPPNRFGLEISAARDRQERLRVERLYQETARQIEIARLAGFDVVLLELRARQALNLNRPATRRQAVEMLAKIKMETPRGFPDDPPPAKPAKRARRRP